MMRDGRTVIRVAIITLILIFIGGYGHFQARKLIEGPMVSVNNPLDGSTTNQSGVDITGTAHNIAFMYLDGRKIFTDDSGVFHENVLLFPGHNVIELKAEDKFGKSTERWITIYRNI